MAVSGGNSVLLISLCTSGTAGCGVGYEHVTRLQRSKVESGLLAELGFENSDQGQKFGWLMVSKIVESKGSGARGGVRMSAVPIGIRLRNPFHRSHDAFDHIIDVGKVSAHSAFVKHINGISVQDSLGKKEQCHIRAAPRAIYGEESKTRGRQAVKLGIRMRHQFVGTFGCRVKADRMVDAVVLRKRRLSVCAIDRAGRSKHEVLDFAVAAALEHIHEGNVARSQGDRSRRALS